MKTLSTVLAVGLVIALTAGTVFSSEYEKREGRESQRSETTKTKFYGTVAKMPDGGTGTWVVDGKEIQVAKDTVIEEEHGKAAVGAYVEVKGSYDGKTFKARKIEVKRAKK